MKLILMMAITVDGKIGKTSEHFPDWTGREDKKLFAAISRKAGAVIMGAKTFDTFGAPLPGRKNIILTRDEERKSDWDNVVFTNKSPRKVVEELEREGFSEAVLGGGAVVNSLFAQEQLIDEIIVTISPKIFGRGVSLFSSAASMDLKLEEVERVGQDLVYLRYQVIK